MYAVVLTGGKQYRVQEGDVIYVEKLNAEVESTVELTEVLAVSNGETLTVGAPVVAGAKVVAKVAAQEKLRKSQFSSISQRRTTERRLVTDNLTLN